MLNQFTTAPDFRQNASQTLTDVPIPKPSTPLPTSHKIEVFCEVCSQTETGTRERLIWNGWGVYSTFSFCPTHEVEF